MDRAFGRRLALKPGCIGRVHARPPSRTDGTRRNSHPTFLAAPPTTKREDAPRGFAPARPEAAGKALDSAQTRFLGSRSENADQRGEHTT